MADALFKMFVLNWGCITGSLSFDLRFVSFNFLHFSLFPSKLGQGILVKVSPMIVKRSKTHMHNLSCGASVILGNNGYIWICPIVNQEENIHGGGFIQNLDVRFSQKCWLSPKKSENGRGRGSSAEVV